MTSPWPSTGLPRASPWCLWAPRWQLCGQFNGSSVPPQTPHPAPGKPSPPAQAGHLEEPPTGLGGRSRSRNTCWEGWQERHPPVISRPCEKAKCSVGGSCLCRLLTPLLYHDLFCSWDLCLTAVLTAVYHVRHRAWHKGGTQCTFTRCSKGLSL